MAGKPRSMRLALSDVENDQNVKAAILSRLPTNYDFEVPKTIWRIRTTNSKRVALQFPEGFLVFATAIADLLEQFTGVDVIILGDVVYGACCVDDFTARALDCDLLVHYGHSCLVSIDRTRQPAVPGKNRAQNEAKTKTLEFLYVFVTIRIDINDLTDKIRANFDRSDKLALCSTIQFANALPTVKRVLETDYGFEHLSIPQCGPLSRGEVLGCTAPRLAQNEALIFVADGRFHIEAVMLANPDADAYRYDPFARALVRERYDYEAMSILRLTAIDRAVATVASRSRAEVQSDSEATGPGRFGVVLSTLGRQGAPHVLRFVEQKIRTSGCEAMLVLLSEIFPEKLRLFNEVHCWVQIACPRLSIDWGAAFNPPLLNSYELSVALNEIEWKTDGYPMDFYANDSSGPWTVNNESHRAAFAASSASSRKPRRTVRVEVEKQATSTETAIGSCSLPNCDGQSGCCSNGCQSLRGCACAAETG